MEIRVNPSSSSECEQKHLILLFLSNILRPDSENKNTVCSLSATSLHQLSNWEIAILIFGLCVCISVMFTTFCCVFFWWQKKKANRRSKQRESAGFQLSTTPVIRSDDVISFVLPSVRILR